MEQEHSVYHIPSYARPEAYAFAEPEIIAPKEKANIGDIYQELSAISEEILQCRAKALQN